MNILLARRVTSRSERTLAQEWMAVHQSRINWRGTLDMLYRQWSSVMHAPKPHGINEDLSKFHATEASVLDEMVACSDDLE
jgi:hypothetical protein